jgi:sporulation protein YlmC with PRC-barrel domain
MRRALQTQHCNGRKPDNAKIMTTGSVSLQGEPHAFVEVRRGMTVTCSEGREAGKIAAVVVSQDSRQVLCLILGHLPKEEGYQSLPVDWIARVEGDMIVLNVRFEMILALPDWHIT